MSSKSLPRPLCGIVPPTLTPLKDRDTLDVAGLERLLGHIVSGGAHGVFILGTTGEGPSLSYRLRREVIDHACRIVGGRAPVLVSITDTAFIESIHLARHAAEAGADAVVLTPPYYLPEGQPELREYLEHVLPELPLPLFLYNMPPLTKVPFELDTVRWAIDQPGVVGMKDSSGNMIYFNQLLALRQQQPDWTILMGPEELLAESVLMGGDGGVNGGANFFPKLYVKLFEAARSGDLPGARKLQQDVQIVAEKIYRVGKHSSAIIKGIKCAASCLGLCSDFMAEPFHKFREPERRQIQQAMDELVALGRSSGWAST